MNRIWYRFTRNPLSLIGSGIVIGVILLAGFAPYLAPYPKDATLAVHFDQALKPPSREHPLGTDEIGRDVLSRVIYGSRISLLLGIVVVILSMLVGVPLGLIAGYWGGKIDAAIMRLTDIFLSIPPIVLAIAVAAALSPTLKNAMLALSFTWWPWYSRLVRGQVLSVREEQFVEASEVLGVNKLRIAFKDILPNCMSPIIVKGTLDVGFAILNGAALSFLGLGAQPPTPDWGTMLSEARLYFPKAWWADVFPGLAIFITVLGFNLLGDGLRDAFDVEVS